MQLRCHKCQQLVDAVFRTNPKGEVGIMHCRKCITKPIDPKVDSIVKVIEADNDARRQG